MSVHFERYLPAVAAAALLSVAGCNKPAPPAQQETAAKPAAVTQIGGENIVKLQRAATSNGAKPEFLSATILPGRGMNLFQITANVPGKGEVNVFASPSLEDASAKLNGQPPADLNGNASFSFGGAFLVPCPNRIRGKLSADGKTITTEWNGKSITLPANWVGKKPGAEKHAMHGLILASKAEDVQTQSTPDGQTVTGVIHAGNFGGYWPSQTDLNFTIALSGDAVEAIITAKNVGNEDEPMAIGWHPYFNIPSGDRTQARLHVPADVYAQVNNYDDVFPTGKLIPVKGTEYDFNEPDGVPLGSMFLDDNFAHLKRSDDNVVVSLTDPASKYGVNIIGESPEIKTVQIYAPPDKSFTAIEEQFNFGDPWGKEWHGMDTGMVTLKPGQSVTWKCKLALFVPETK
ncbi:aldose 1-epimerase [Alloacidobacterium sp.]|uniref:aldose 1-epimerase n=1 Tax=Alloacidobacterium sp. TaxID=2951999 RepID=UPI002D6AC051|nr:aldose 1-epimerase [Alloacidobacterium sp.]HYK36302.1 aldose 1-epimerase [Alloacidobacterium sp.]